MSHDRLYLWSFLGVGWIVQVIAFYWAGESVLSLISGLLGICSVVLCSQGNIWTFFFGFGQIGTYMYLCWQQRLYGEIGINTFYFLSQFYGIYIWHTRRSAAGSSSLPTRSLSIPTAGILAMLTLMLSALCGWGLSYTDDSQPYLDAFTTIPAIVAQVLMVLAYREHWFVWLIIDILYIALWVRAGDWCMSMQYTFWCINAIYGFIRWSKVSTALDTSLSKRKR